LNVNGRCAQWHSFGSTCSMNNPYALLGVAHDASATKIRTAYKELSRKWHPDKDRSVTAEVATARFQRLKAAYEQVIDPKKRSEVDATIKRNSASATPKAAKQASDSAKRQTASATAFTASFQKAWLFKGAHVFSRPRTGGRSPTNATATGTKRARHGLHAHFVKSTESTSTCETVPDSDDEVKNVFGPGARPVGVDVLDSDEEQAQREAELQAAEYVRRKHDERRTRRAAQQAQRLLERKRAKPYASTGQQSAAMRGHVRLSFRKHVGETHTLPSSGDINAAFAELGFEVLDVLSLCAQSAVLAVKTEAQALSCTLAFHGWPGRSLTDEAQVVLRKVSIVTGPVASSGRALAGQRTTVTATRKKIASCDQSGAKFL